MKDFYKIVGFLVIIVGGVFFSEEASAQRCRVQARRGANFGNYDPLASGNLDTTSRIRVQCRRHNRIPFYTVKIGPGSAASYSPRQMFKGSEPLGYNLYIDSARSTIWGDGTSGTSFVTVSPAVANRSFTVYGRTPLGQSVSAGLYSDTVTVTVEW